MTSDEHHPRSAPTQSEIRNPTPEIRPGRQRCASVAGRRVLHDAAGDARPGEPLTTDHRMLWLSAGKPLTALAVAVLVERGDLDFDDPVAELLPGFEQHGKHDLTLRHLLTHTAGFRAMRDQHPHTTWDETLEQVFRARLEPGWRPGIDAGYHVQSSWYALGAVVCTVTDQPFDAALQQLVLDPLALTSVRVRIAGDDPDKAGVYDATTNPPRDSPLNDPAWAAALRPGGNVWGTAADLVRMYELTLDLPDAPPGTLDGVTLLQPATIAEMTSRQRRDTRDRTFNAVIDWGLGFCLNSEHLNATPPPYGFGPHATRDAFGHGGARCAMGLADPGHGLAAAIIFNTQPDEPTHQHRMRSALTELYETLSR